MAKQTDELEFKTFVARPVVVEALRRSGGDWLVRTDNKLHVLMNKRFEELYTPTDVSRVSELEAELKLYGPLNRPWTAKHGSLDLSNPPRSFTAVTPPLLYGRGMVTPPDPRDQPMPTKGRKLVAPHARDMFEAVMQHQEAKGLKKYGTPLMTDNGRKPLQDLLGELIDAVMYCTQAILEQMHREDEDAG